MNSEEPSAVEAADPVAPVAKVHFATRALAPSASLWFAMFAASALGTNLGDFSAWGLAQGLTQSFGTLAVISALMIWGDLELGRKTELFFWLAIVLLRAGATNIGDLLTHQLGLSYIFATAALGAATLVAGRFTLSGSAGATSPLIDLRYWGAMFIGGVFGTVGGDLMSRSVGLFPAALLLIVVLVVAIRARAALGPTSMVGYWCIVLAERAAGTPTGDAIADEHGLSFGLPLAMTIACAALLVGLWLRRGNAGGKTSVGGGWAPALGLAARWVLIVYSLLGSGIMATILVKEHPRSPWLVLYFIVGLAFNFLFLIAPEVARLGAIRPLRLVALWFNAKYADFQRWMDAKEGELRARARQGQPAE